jgi:hypothetical protein
VGETERLAGWTLAEGGIVAFDAPPPAGAVISAGFRFDVRCGLRRTGCR